MGSCRLCTYQHVSTRINMYQHVRVVHTLLRQWPLTMSAYTELYYSLLSMTVKAVVASGKWVQSCGSRIPCLAALHIKASLKADSNLSQRQYDHLY